MTLRLRMVAIGEVFARFPRVVRDLSRELGKDIELAIRGAETELDKSMVDRIGDPLMHLVRNAIDHGIETAETRQARGKPARGTVALHAYHESGSITIEVSDDGGGLDRERIRQTAIQKAAPTPNRPTGSPPPKKSPSSPPGGQHRSPAGDDRHRFRAGAEHHHAPVPAADAGDHRRLPRRRRRLALHHPARHGRRVPRTPPRSRRTPIPRTARPGPALRSPAPALRRTGAATPPPARHRRPIRPPPGRPGRRSHPRPMPDRDQTARPLSGAGAPHRQRQVGSDVPPGRHCVAAAATAPPPPRKDHTGAIDARTAISDDSTGSST